MKTYKKLWQELCSYENLYLAYRKARKHKTTKDYVVEFERDLKNNLDLLRCELLLHCYNPKPLVNFIIRDPKTRKISKSDFRDRVIHHALCNVIEPIFDKLFISDSFANRLGKGTLKALQRFDYFKRKVSRNNTMPLKHKIKDSKVLWLIQRILKNCAVQLGGSAGFFTRKEGMPLGNLTSQFFANIYLNELDQFVKYNLQVKYYIRYVDDFVILHSNKNILHSYKNKINKFLKQRLDIELHPGKSRIFRLKERLTFLGFRIFYYHRLLKKSNLRKNRRKVELLKQQYKESTVDYDFIYDFFEGWMAYAKQANTYKLRKKIAIEIEREFPNEISTKEINRMTKSLQSASASCTNTE